MRGRARSPAAKACCPAYSEAGSLPSLMITLPMSSAWALESSRAAHSERTVPCTATGGAEAFVGHALGEW